MDDQKKNDAFHGAEADEFWDISKLIPQKTSRIPEDYRSYVRAHVRTSDTTFSPIQPKREDSCVQAQQLRLTEISAPSEGEALSSVGENGETKEECYAPAFNSLIKNVRIVHLSSAVSFYRRFQCDAVRYFNAEAPKEAVYTPFYSYVPQYSQLTKKQLDYYLFWREAFRRGEYLACDEAYFRLFVYEILNLPDLISPEDGLSMLCNAFCAYRQKMPRIEKYMTQWLIDYCLLYRLPCPASALSSCMDAIMKNTVFPEFFLFDVENLPDCCVEMLLTLASDYRRRPQKDNEEREQFLSLHMAGAMRAVFFTLFSKHGAVDFGRTSHMTSNVFAGSIPAHNIRVRLEIDYHPFSLASELGETVRNAAKYAENRLRALLGIRTRVRADLPPAELAAVIDDYVLTHCPKKSAPAQPKSAYEHLYEPQEAGISWDSIQGIENASWEVTRRLTAETTEDELSAEDADCFKNVNNSLNIQGQKEAEKDEEGQQEKALSRVAFDYLCLRVQAKTGEAVSLLIQAKVSENSVIEEINEAFLLRYGDVFFENTGDGYSPLLEDYETEVTEWIREMNG